MASHHPRAAHLPDMNQNRTPAGVPTGGQFAEQAKAEAFGVHLDDGPEVLFEFQIDGSPSAFEVRGDEDDTEHELWRDDQFVGLFSYTGDPQAHDEIQECAEALAERELSSEDGICWECQEDGMETPATTEDDNGPLCEGCHERRVEDGLIEPDDPQPQSAAGGFQPGDQHPQHPMRVLTESEAANLNAWAQAGGPKKGDRIRDRFGNVGTVQHAWGTHLRMTPDEPSVEGESFTNEIAAWSPESVPPH